LFLKKSLVFEWPVSQGHSGRNIILLLFFLALIEKTYYRECTVYMYTVLSSLPLASLLSLLHATDVRL